MRPTAPLKDKLIAPINEQEARSISKAIIDRIEHKYPDYYSKSHLSSWMYVAAAFACIVIFSLTNIDVTPPLLLKNVDGSALTLVKTKLTSKDITFNDGSTVSIEPNSELKPIVNKKLKVSWRLSKGKANFDINRQGRVWQIHIIDSYIEVLGTKFSVTYRKDIVSIRVTQGRVKVVSPSINKELTAGESINLKKTTSSQNDDTISSANAGNQSQPPVSTQKKTSLKERDTHTNLKRYKRPKKSPLLDNNNESKNSPLVKQVKKKQITPARQPTEDIETLSKLADEARVLKQWDKASALLNQLIEQSPKGKFAAITSLSKARLDLIQRKRPKQALAELNRAEALNPPLALQEEILALKVITSSKLGKIAQAKRLANLYIKLFKNGKFKKEVEPWL